MGARIIACEPSRANFEQFLQNLAHNPTNKVTPVRAAIATTSGTGSLQLSNSTNHHLTASGTPGTEPVTLLSLLDLMQQYAIGHIDFLKLDCEGTEYAILPQLSPTLFERITTISLEFHHGTTPDRTGLALTRLLRKNGYRIVSYRHAPTRQGLNYGYLIATRD